MSGYLQKGIKGSAIIATASILASIFGFVTRSFLARILNASDFGLFYSVWAFFLVIQIFTSFGYPTALVRFIAYNHNKDSKKENDSAKLVMHVFIINFLLTILVAVLIFLFANMLSTYFFKSTEALYLLYWVGGFMIVSFINTIASSIFQAFQNMLCAGLISFFNKFIFFAFCVLFYFLGFSRTSSLPMQAYILGITLCTLIFVIPALKLISFKGLKKNFEKSVFLNLTSFALPSFMTQTAGLMISYLDTLILTIFVSLQEVGIYNSAIPTMLLITQVTGAITTTLFPMVAELHAKNKESKVRQALDVIYRFTICLIIPISIITFVYPAQLLRLFFGPQFISGALSLRILAIGTLFIALAKINFSVFNGLGKPSIPGKATVIAAIINVVFNFIFIPFFGIIAAAATTTLSYIIMFSVSYVKLKKTTEFRFTKKFSVFICGIVFLLIILPFSYSHHIWIMIISCLLATIVYGILCIYFKLIDVRIILNAFKRII